MALFSLSTSQLLLAFVSASILSKLTSHNFFLRWLASRNFTYFKAPQDNELRQLKDNPTSKKSSKSTRRNRREAHEPQEQGGLFKIALKDMGRIRLTEVSLKLEDLISINYGTELEWVIGLAIMSAFSYSITEFQFFIFPQTGDFNFSLLWALIVILSSVKLLWALTAFYFKYDESLGERTLCIAVGCAFLLISMIVLTVDENRLEFGLIDTYKAFFKSSLVNQTTPSSSQPSIKSNKKEASVIMLKLVIALVSAFFGAMFTFPGIRFGQLQRAILDDPNTSRIRRILIIFNYLCPLLVVLLWVKPLTKDPILKQQYIHITDATFDTLRIYCIILTNLLKASLMTLYARTFLRSAAQRIVRLTRQPGFATNRDIKTLMASIPQYAHAVIIQYLIPTILCLFATIMFKTLSGQQWIPQDMISEQLSNPVIANTTGLNQASEILDPTSSPYGGIISNIVPTSVRIAVIGVKAMFSPIAFRGLLGFAAWWLHFAWFCTSSLGLAYHMYFV